MRNYQGPRKALNTEDKFSFSGGSDTNDGSLL